MTESEIVQLIQIVRVCFPNWRDSNDPRARVQTWAAMLREVPLDLAAAAVHELAIHTEFAPGPGQVLRAAREVQARLTGAADLDADQAIVAVRDAIARYGYPREDEAMAQLTEATQAAIRACGGWQGVCASTNDAAFRAHFHRMYDLAVDRSKRARHAAPTQPALPRPDEPVRLDEALTGALSRVAGRAAHDACE